MLLKKRRNNMEYFKINQNLFNRWMNGEILVTTTPETVYWLNKIVFDEKNKFINKNYFRGIAIAYKAERLPDDKYHCYSITSIYENQSDLGIFDIRELYIFPEINKERVLECQRKRGFVKFDPEFDYMRYFISVVYPETRFPLDGAIEYHYVQLFETGFKFVKYLDLPLIYDLRSFFKLQEDTPSESLNKFKFGDLISINLNGYIEPCYYVAEIDSDNKLHLITYNSLDYLKEEDYLKGGRDNPKEKIVVTVVKENQIRDLEGDLEELAERFRDCVNKFIDNKMSFTRFNLELEKLSTEWLKLKRIKKAKG